MCYIRSSNHQVVESPIDSLKISWVIKNIPIIRMEFNIELRRSIVCARTLNLGKINTILSIFMLINKNTILRERSQALENMSMDQDPWCGKAIVRLSSNCAF